MVQFGYGKGSRSFCRRAALICGVASNLSASARAKDTLLAACKQARHRKQFFVPSGEALGRRGITIFNIVDDLKLAPSNNPGKVAWQTLCVGDRPLSLDSILRIDRVLKLIAEHPDLLVRQTTEVPGKSFLLDDNSVFPSIWYTIPEEVLDQILSVQYERKEQSNRTKLSNEIYNHKLTLDILELGEGGRHARVTRAFVEKTRERLGASIADLFTLDQRAGQRNGENTFALPVTRGNVLIWEPGVYVGDQPE